MGIAEKLGYVRGLADGLDIKDTTPEGKVLLALVDLVGEMAENFMEVGLLVRDLEESVDDLISDVYDEENSGGDSRIRIFPGASGFFEQDDDEDGGDEEETDGDPRCISCGHPVEITAEILREGFVKCPKCGQQMALEIQGGDCECGGGHGGCGHSDEE